MSQNRRSKQSAASSRRKLRVATGALGETPGQRLHRWWHRGFRKSSFSTVYAIFLLPPAWVLSATFFNAFHRTTVVLEFWRAAQFWFFTLGAIVWLLAFFGGMWATGTPWGLRVYVFGHELTHAVWVWLWRGRVLDQKMWSADGGYIITDTNNVWIALAPYFYPIYSIMVIVCYRLAGFFYDVIGSPAAFLLMTPLQWLFFLLGVSWCFHLSFTVWMIPKGQTDLTTHGTPFSLMVIYLMNLLLLALALIMVSPDVSFASFGADLWENTLTFSAWAWSLLAAFAESLLQPDPGH